jgi:hypothetical protein
MTAALCFQLYRDLFWIMSLTQESNKEIAALGRALYRFGSENIRGSDSA